MVIKVLGGGCNKCIRLAKNVELALEELGQEAEIVKVTDYAEITTYNVMTTPALVFDEVVVSYGKVLSVKQVKQLLQN